MKIELKSPIKETPKHDQITIKKLQERIPHVCIQFYKIQFLEFFKQLNL